MDKLKTKGNLTIVATVCIALSLFAGFGFLPAAGGFNCLWHAMFPQLLDTNPTASFGCDLPAPDYAPKHKQVAR